MIDPVLTNFDDASISVFFLTRFTCTKAKEWAILALANEKKTSLLGAPGPFFEKKRLTTFFLHDSEIATRNFIGLLPGLNDRLVLLLLHCKAVVRDYKGRIGWVGNVKALNKWYLVMELKRTYARNHCNSVRNLPITLFLCFPYVWTGSSLSAWTVAFARVLFAPSQLPITAYSLKMDSTVRVRD